MYLDAIETRFRIDNVKPSNVRKIELQKDIQKSKSIFRSASRELGSRSKSRKSKSRSNSTENEESQPLCSSSKSKSKSRSRSKFLALSKDKGKDLIQEKAEIPRRPTPAAGLSLDKVKVNFK